jgi:phage nucleotide-binding protein
MKFETPSGPTMANVLVHGMSGAGKTVFAGTAAPVGKTLLADVEAGTMSIMDKITTGAIQAVKIDKYQDFTDMILELKNSDHGFDTLVVDSGTELQKLYLEMVGGNKEMPTLQDYGKLANETRKSLRFLRDLPMNLIYITLSKDEKDEQFGSIVRKPSLTGKLPEEACGYMDLVLYITTKEIDGKVERVAITQPTERLYAKDRSGKLERYEKPDFAVIYGKIFGHVAQATTKPKGKGGKGA